MRLYTAIAIVAFLSVVVSAQSSTRCCMANEGHPFTMSCTPGTVIDSVTFASYGDSQGYCGRYSLGSCHASASKVALERCVGQQECSFSVTNEMFGGDPCPGAGKYLTAQWTCRGSEVRFSQPLDGVPPLSTSGRFIVDSTSRRVKMAAVNWYGAHCMNFVPNGLHLNSVYEIARHIKQAGFNTVRLNWSNEMVQRNPLVETQYVAANPQFIGKTALEVYDAVVEALGEAGVYVILDNHISDADWCCNPNDENGLWYNKRFSYDSWVNDWAYMAARHRSRRNVIAAELRNELRFSCGFNDTTPRDCRYPSWGDGDPLTDWQIAATRVGNAIHAQNPNLLVMPSGLVSGSRLEFVRKHPIVLNTPNKLVYVAHDYPWWHPDYKEYEPFASQLEEHWGYLANVGTEHSNALFLSEFGTCHNDMNCITEHDGDGGGLMQGGRWFQYLVRYLKEKDIDFAYWAWNGSTCKGENRSDGVEEGYGIADQCWAGIAFTPLLDAIKQIQKPVQFP
eukprot:TRINITY_DN827_c0_g4_i1.p1 TRINITY_DN827_c0_g4~~TRINITY_DN827_c0_g4_i1.p1  ORF type:complete len:507 (-),score=96.68 TRINITY_DN827_c0_g4_i1:158-1678(-)